MNSKERVLAILNGQAVDRTPVDLWYTGEVSAALHRHFGTTDELALWRALGLDKIAWVWPSYTGPQLSAQTDAIVDMWGVRYKRVEAGAAEYAERMAPAPLAHVTDPAELNDFPWPDPAQFNFDATTEQARRIGAEYATIGPWVSFFEVYCAMRGLEQALMDVLMFPDLVNAILDRIEDVQTRMMKNYFNQAAQYLDLCFISDDMGSQSSLLISLDSWDQFFKPRMKRWCDLIHSYGMKAFYHTDGAAFPLIGRLIEAGVDVLNPIQHICPGMELESLQREYAGKVIFHGGVDNQHALPFGTPADVRQETEHCLATLGRRGGYICCSCHNVQAGTPVENILAMIETVHQKG